MTDKVTLPADKSVETALAKARSDEGAPNALVVIGYNPEKKTSCVLLLRRKGE